MNLQESIAKRICKLCLENELSYYALSYRSAVPLTTILHIIDGTTHNTKIATISRICSGLDLSLAEFFTAEEFTDMECEEN